MIGLPGSGKSAIGKELARRLQLPFVDSDRLIESRAGCTIASLFEHARGLAAEIGYTLEDLKTGGGSDGNFTAALAPTLDGLGVDGRGGHTHYEQIRVSSIAPRSRLFYRLFETLQ